jgi:hypothetical protein
MEEVSKSFVLHNLGEDWSNFLKQYSSLSQEDKEKYLIRQGFNSYSDLLSHIIAWWEEAVINIPAILENPGYKSPEYDVDKFNAEVVRKHKGKNEKETITIFEEKRNRLMGLIATIDEAQIKNAEMQKELYWNITNHFTDHKI